MDIEKYLSKEVAKMMERIHQNNLAKKQYWCMLVNTYCLYYELLERNK